MILLNKESILQRLDDKTLDITLVQSIDSTNNAFETHSPTENFSACLAEEQIQGRGQFQRAWHSPFGENIYLSLCYYSRKSLSSLSGLSLVVGCAICKVLNTLVALKEPALIKWPNDILCNNAKIAGLLIETKKIQNETHRIIIGIGLNVNMQNAENAAISQNWTSLFRLTGASHDRNVICAELINQVRTFISLFEQEGFAKFAPLWNEYNAFSQKTLQIHHNQMNTIGKCIGVSSKAELILELKNGEKKFFSSGEISLYSQGFLNTTKVFIKYFVVAMLSYGVDISVFSILLFSNVNLIYSLVNARIVSSLFNFTCNKWFVYQAKNIKSAWRELTEYIFLVGVNIALSYGIIMLEKKYLKIPDIPAKILADGFLFLFSFYIQKKIVFRKPKKDKL